MKYIIQKISNNNINEITTPEDYFVVAQSDNPALSFDGNQFIADGDDNLIFPVVEIRETGDPPLPIIYVVENFTRVFSYNTLLTEQEILKFEIMSEDYSTGTIPQLRKLARLRQLELILASGSF